jgi:hypothetical protein
MITVTTENKAFVRDINSKALLLNDRKNADDYTSRKTMLQKQKLHEVQIDEMKEDINTIKTNLEEMMKILKGLKE